MRTKKYTQELENTVKIRTSELEELNKDNTTIISMVCHDISTPIMLAHGHLNQIFKKGLKQEQDLLKGLNKIDVNLSLVSDILKKVKHMQSVKLGKIEPVIEKCDVEPLIHETIEIFSLNFLEKKIIPKVFIRENSIIEAFIDPTLFKSQIMGNLISNAIKFSNTGEQIEFSVINNERFVEVSIRNYGAGISSDKIHNIFNINKNTSTKGTNAEAGTGLGLPTVKIITERMGGSVSVMAEDIIENDKIIKSATTFTVTLKSAV
jgi:signal transduction histidine kinase